ncbi:MAG: aminotransferase class III-fold pyridoxal phosphate-dependent enzyme [Acidobacteria bacterium]|nr:aminotransferase class III-fold pyridoxal phosphate-dependent enzyme [Acidobacteriota bacterium]
MRNYESNVAGVRVSQFADRNAITQECFQKGLLLLGCGASSIRLCPPLVIDQHDADRAVDILDEVLSAMKQANEWSVTP